MAPDVDVHQPLRTIVTTLSQPVTSSTHLSSTLTTLVQLLGNAAIKSHRHVHDDDDQTRSPGEKTIKLVSQIQIALVEKVLPVWYPVLDTTPEGSTIKSSIIEVFVPTPNDQLRVHSSDQLNTRSGSDIHASPSSSNNLPTLIALTSLQTISLNLTITPSPLPLLIILNHLITTYPIEKVYHDLFSFEHRADGFGSRKKDIHSDLFFKGYLGSILSLPSKVSNTLGRLSELKFPGPGQERLKDLDGLEGLEEGRYWARLFNGLEEVLWGLSLRGGGGGAGEGGGGEDELDNITPLIPLFTRLETLHFFPASDLLPTTSSSSLRPSFFQSTFPRILSHLADPNAGSAYGSIWQVLLDEVSRGTARTIGVSFFSTLTSRIRTSSSTGTVDTREVDIDRPPDGQIKRASSIIFDLLGPPSTSPSGPLISILLPSILSKQGNHHSRSPILGKEWEAMSVRARVFVAYVGMGGKGCVGLVLGEVMKVWGDGEEVKWGLMGRGAFLTLLVILLVSLLPPYDPLVTQITFHSPFLISMQSYLGHSDSGIRRLGMLVGEIISNASLPPTEADRERAKARARAGAKAESKKHRDDRVVSELEGMLDELNTEDDKGPGIKNAAMKGTPAAEPKVKRLDFGKSIWEGVGGGKEECRWLRAHEGLRDGDAEIDKGDALLGWLEADTGSNKSDQANENKKVPVEVDSDDEPTVPKQTRGRSTKTKTKPARPPPETVDSDDDSLVGYSDESRSSSRSPSPTPSYLEEVANDPMLNTSTRAKIQRPVYLIQLLELLRARTEPEKLEVALKWGEELIRRKRDYGTELDENAEELVVQSLALSDPFDLEDFEVRRQGIIIALTACSPRHVAPLLIRLYFEAQYSLLQRSAILTGLSMGSRECAGLILATEPRRAKVDFPSKFLPPALHAKYASNSDPGFTRANQAIIDTTTAVTNEALRRGRDATSGQHEISRHRQLRVQGSSARGKITDLQQGSRTTLQAGLAAGAPPPKVAFKDIAAEYFILPMINRFWTYLQEEITREQQTQKRYTVGGTGMILSALSVAQFLSTLTIMVHAALNSPLYLSVICPEALELAISVGSKLSVAPTFAPMGGPPDTKHFEADVVGTALELALVSLDGAKELDGGRALATEKSLTLMAAGEWASEILQKETRGEATTTNVGGTKEGRVQKAAAGVLVLVSGIVEKMQALMT